MIDKKMLGRKCEKCENCSYPNVCGQNNSGGMVYGLGLIGALIYFYPQMIGFNGFVMSLGKSLVWPGLLVFEALKLLNL